MQKWVKPQIIVLVRSKPEESLLGACKAALSGTEPQNAWPGCAYYSPGTCLHCNTNAES